MKIGRREFLIGAAAAGPLARSVAAADQPFNRVRSIMRLFVSDVEDKPWFNDREMWPAYFSMLSEQRFNRFQLALGIGYDFLRDVTDCYFVFAYPFLLKVPGYDVRAVGLPDAEREHNLETLKYISEQAAAHGLHFQLGLWTHGYEWANSPHANYTIAGLTAQTHAPYCRDALAMLLRACPAISGVTFRVHGESGVAEGSYDFWKTVFEGVTRSGRTLEIDMHAKGMDQQMIDVALATGMPVKISPKFWAEHMGMPYHQTAIREQEMPHGARTGQMALSTGTRSFTRYSYGDLMREDRKYSVLHRIWPGTQRMLLWGDPLTAAAYSRAFAICGSSGVEIMEPLSFKGRRGSGKPGGRCGYADASLNPRWDWQKYLRTYRVWGAALFDPEARQESEGAELALASASRILPIVTSSYGPSAANNTYWPEMYTVQPMVDPGHNNPYSDTPSPKVFGNASPFDPQMFSTMNGFAGELLKGERSGKYSPVDVAQWLEDLAENAVAQLAKVPAQKTAEFRRMAIDVNIQAALGRFFAARFRSGVLYGIHEHTGDRMALEEAIRLSRSARETWAAMAGSARGVYAADVTFGELPWLHGHWLDRLPAIESDIADMAKRLEGLTQKPQEPSVQTAIAAALSHARRQPANFQHTPPAHLPVEDALYLELIASGSKARVRYRHFNQAERFESVEMGRIEESARLRAAIPAGYINSPYPLQYYFEVSGGPQGSQLYPGFDANHANQPYFLVRPA